MCRCCMLVQVCQDVILCSIVLVNQTSQVTQSRQRSSSGALFIVMDGFGIDGIDGIDEEACLYGILGESICFFMQMFCICEQDMVLCKVKIFTVAGRVHWMPQCLSVVVFDNVSTVRPSLSGQQSGRGWVRGCREDVECLLMKLTKGTFHSVHCSMMFQSAKMWSMHPLPHPLHWRICYQWHH